MIIFYLSVIALCSLNERVDSVLSKVKTFLAKNIKTYNLYTNPRPTLEAMFQVNRGQRPSFHTEIYNLGQEKTGVKCRD